MRIIIDYKAIVDATEKLKRFCKLQKECTECKFYTDYSTGKHCGLNHEFPHEWNWEKIANGGEEDDE